MKATSASSASSGTANARLTDEPDHRGLFYRIVAAGPDLPVLAIGAPFVRNWFSHVETGDLRALWRRLPTAPRFAMVILHSTLGGCVSIAEALLAAHAVLEPGGIVALAGVNRLRAAMTRNMDTTAPCATPWGFRRAATQAGFEQVDLYVAQPDLDEPAYVISTAPASSRAFFRHEVVARKASGRDRFPVARTVLAELNLAPYLQPFFVMVGKK
ncbi:MAG: hypothetical protein ABI900_08860 [Betaproteobacteria bacterium]